MSRAGKISSVVGRLLLSLILFVGVVAARAAETAPPRGGRVGWGRLINQGARWTTHQDNDPQLASFIRTQTSLNMDPVCYPIDVAKLDRLCEFPFVFTNDFAAVRNPRARQNVAEYLRRGGFLYVDACVSHNVTPDFNLFLKQQRAAFAEIFPNAEIRRLPEDHVLFHSYFEVREPDFHLAYDREISRDESNDGFYGVFEGKRMIALISLRGLQCAWGPQPVRIPACMKMIVNIYVYAMTRAE